MSVATLLTQPNSRKVYLATLTVGYTPKSWSGSGTTWSCPIATPARVVDCKANGVTCAYSWSGSTKTLTVTGISNPYTSHGQAILQLHYSYPMPKLFDSIRYEPRIVTIPEMQIQIESRFGDLGKCGLGSLRLQNTDGYFDAMRTHDWAAGSIELSLGVDMLRGTTWDEMDLTDYEPLGSWAIEQVEFDREKIDIRLIEPKSKLDASLGADKFKQGPLDASTYTYPFLVKEAEGKTIPWGFGRIRGAPAFCVDTHENLFKFAAHPVFSLDNVTVAGVPADIDPADRDLDTAEFTIADWDGTSEVLVDFTGVYDANIAANQALKNPADVLEYLFDYAGETSRNSTAWAAARALWVQGTRNNREWHTPAISLYIDDTTKIRDLVEQICAAAFAVLYQGLNGEWMLHHWQPKTSEGIYEFTDNDEFGISTKYDGRNIITRVVGKYRKHITADYAQVTEATNDAALYRHGLTEHQTLEEELPMSEKLDAETWVGRMAATLGGAQEIVEIELSHRAFMLAPSDMIKISTERLGIDGVFELTDMDYDLNNGTVSGIAGNVRGFGDGPGFWVADNPTLPVRFATHAGYGAGSAATWNTMWSNEIKQWARENAGYWTDDDGFIEAPDTESYMGSTYV